MDDDMHNLGPDCTEGCVALANLRGEVKAIAVQVHGLDHNLNGNGQPGFIADVNVFIAELRGGWKLAKIIGAVVAALVVAIGVMVGYLTYKDTQRKSSLHPPSVSIEHAPQDAAMPLGMTRKP
jgi:hypothetical protein